MKKTAVRRTIIIIVCAALIFLLGVFGYMEAKLIEFEKTGPGDTLGVIAVNLGKPYYVLSTEKDPSDPDKTRQIIMADDFKSFDAGYLTEIGCTETDRNGDSGTYEAADGTVFTVCRGDRAGRLFCTFEITGATMEQIDRK